MTALGVDWYYPREIVEVQVAKAGEPGRHWKRALVTKRSERYLYVTITGKQPHLDVHLALTDADVKRSVRKVPKS